MTTPHMNSNRAKRSLRHPPTKSHNMKRLLHRCRLTQVSYPVVFAVLGLLVTYALLLRRALELQSLELYGQSPDQCRTQTQLCMAEVGATVNKCTAQQELPLPWAPREGALQRQRRQRNSGNANPQVCMIVTTYNVEAYVGECLETVLGQTYEKLEIIVVDDASTDGTAKIVKKYAQKDKRLRMIELRHNTNGGVGQPSNIGMENCSPLSEYIMFVDGDDYFELDAVESVVEQALKIDADVAMANFDIFTVDETSGQVNFTAAYDHEKWIQLAAEIPFNILTHPVVLRASPVPWRKLYKRSFMQTYDLKFPEGDYFYEDNTFHWMVLGHAARVVKIDRVLFHHRRQRKGQTSFSFETKKKKGEQKAMVDDSWWDEYSGAVRIGGYFPNLYQIGELLFTGFQKNLRSTCTRVAVKDIAQVYFEFLAASRWIRHPQKTKEMKEKFMRLFVQYRDHWVDHIPFDYKADLASSIYFESGVKSKDVDLSIIMPTLNVADLLPSLLESMYKGLQKSPNLTFEVFAVDDGSSDGTQQILREFAAKHKDNFVLLSTSSGTTQLGAGRARNRAIPLVEGRYVYFVDTDDVYDFPALAKSVEVATKRKVDLLILPYKTEYVKLQGSKIEGMLSKDQRGWNRIWSSWWWPPTGQDARKSIALDLINYPWKQLTSSKLIRDADVFFGPTRVHNDVQFHWTSIVASRNLQFHNEVVCTHRKFDPAVRGQLTEVKSVARLTAIDAIGLTQRALARQGAFEEAGGDQTLKQWIHFVKDLVKWAADRVPDEWIPEYQDRSKRLMEAWKTEDPASLRTWPYWVNGLVESPIPSAKVKVE